MAGPALPHALGALVWGMLQELDADPKRGGLKETPDRVARYWEQMTRGKNATDKDIGELLKTFTDGASGYDEMIVKTNIPFYSVCEHHMVTFFGVAHIAYIPNKKILGLSKFARLVELLAAQLQVQERLTKQIADALNKHLKPKGVGVVLTARHLCEESRGIKSRGSATTTSALRGVIKARGAREEFLGFVRTAEMRGPAV